MVEYLKIPSERIALLLSDNQKIKKQIETATKTKIEVDKELNEVVISETSKSELLMVWKACDIVKAIGRGFEPEIAFKLLRKGFELYIIEVKDYIGKNKKGLIRIKGRVIGKQGKSKKKIQDLTGTDISIYGKTIAIIGKSVDVDIAAHGIELLLEGAMHNTAFKSIKKELKERINEL